jgi:hypothetical protein
MGKKTDKFTADLIQQGGVCESLVADLIKAAEEIDANGVEWDKHAFPYSDYYARLMRQGLKNDAEMIKADPDFKPYYDNYMRVQGERDAIWTRGRTAVVKLQEKLGPLGVTINDFKKYIDKKAKSKNPFRGKKSVPAAQETIKLYLEFKKYADAALSELRSKFR